MIKCWPFAIILLLSTGFAAEAAPSIGQQIRDAEKGVNDAYGANDLPRYFSYYAPDLRALYPEGPTTLPDYVASWSAFIHKGGRIESFSYKDMHVQVSPAGDAAVASYQATARQKEPDGRVHTDNFSETDVWFQRQGAWKIVEIHYSEISAKP
jgi:ketosteroid isomerase-like protein